MQTHFPYSIYSESAGAVNFKNSLSAPAIVIPGISQVSVYDATKPNVNRFFERSCRNFFAFSTSPWQMIDTLSTHSIYKRIFSNLLHYRVCSLFISNG